MQKCATFFLLLCVLFSSIQTKDIYSGLVNKQVVRNINLASQLARHVVEVTVENVGQPTSVYYLTFEKETYPHLAHIAVTSKDVPLKATQEESGHDYNLYRVDLQKELASGSSLELVVKLVYSKLMTPFPVEITQSERQLVRYNDNHYWYSPYTTNSLKTKVKLSTSLVQSNSELSPSQIKGDVVTYGPYKNVPAFSHSLLSLHFENNKPFITITNNTRWIEVSHWGNIAMEERVQLRHDGAKLKGPFSRYEFQINTQANGQAAVQVIKQYLPETAADAYYRDDIGNISTSHWRLGSPKQTIDLRPRFPLFGGWRTDYTLGYNLPTAPFLGRDYNDGSRYILNISFIADWDFAVTYDHQDIMVILPEGAHDIHVIQPFADTEVDTSGRHVTYLDVASIGRPVVRISKKNLVNEHNEYFQVSYRFGTTSMLLEPLLLIIGYFSAFVAIIIVLRLQFTISDESTSHSNTDPETIQAVTKIGDLIQNRARLAQQLDDAHKSYISSVDAPAWDKETKSIQTFIAKAKREIESSIASIKKKNEALAQKLLDIDAKQSVREDTQSKLHKLIIDYKIEPKKISQQKYKQDKPKLDESYKSLAEEIEEALEDIL